MPTNQNATDGYRLEALPPADTRSVFENREANGDSNCRVGWSLVAIVLFFGVDCMIADMVLGRRNTASLPRESATLVLAKSANI